MTEISESLIIRDAIIRLCSGLIKDSRTPMLVERFLGSDNIVTGISKLTAAILQSPEVRHAAAGAAASVLASEEVQSASVKTTIAVMQDPSLMCQMEVLFNRPEVAGPLAGQAAALIEDLRVQQAVIKLMREVLSNDEVKTVLHRRAVSLVGDGEVFQAGRRGVAEALFPGSCFNSESRD